MFGVALGVEEESEVEELVAEAEAEAQIDETRLGDADDADATDSSGSQKGGDRS
jgi:hypothetical protein